MAQANSYTRTAKSLHWLIGFLILCAFALGWTMVNLGISPLKVRMFNWHKWLGIVILALVVVRAGWRLTHPPPALLPMPRWQSVAAHALHGLLYALLFAQPLSGWAYSNAAGYPIVVFGLVRLPNLVSKNKPLAASLEAAHFTLGWLLLACVIAHALAALQHHFIARDGTLRRMLY
jgi:cytochrome b561